MRSRRPTFRLATLTGVYVVLLTASHFLRWVAPAEVNPRAGQTVAMVHERGHKGEALSRQVGIAYQDIPADEPDAPVVILIHGSPVGSRAFEPLIEELRGRVRIISPDLPGYDRSTPRVTSGSFLADVAYLRELQDQLGIASAHWIAYSRGGGPAIYLAADHAEHVESLSLISAIGVQEEELLGDYALNHALHGAQLFALSTLEALVPHFGYLDNAIFNRAYAKGFFDADQRPLRDRLRRIRQPTLILHGIEDALVPFAAAREHHRLVPQSELVILPDKGHLVVIREPGVVAPVLLEFIQRVEAGTASHRHEATEDRIRAAFDPEGYTPSALAPSALAFILLILILSTLVSEDLTCIIAGILVAKGTLEFGTATVACFSGILLGDMALFLVGRWFGQPILRRRPLRWMMRPSQVERAAVWFRKRGAIVIFASRFVPGARLPTYVIAGSVGVNPLRFLVYFAGAAAIWTPAVVGLSWAIGTPILGYFEDFAGQAVIGLFVVILGLFLFLKLLFPLCSHNGRRMLLGRWLRLRRWEYWPSWSIYSTVLPWILWKSWRVGGSPVLCSVTNPAFPCSGLIHESKSAILEAFGDLPEMPRWSRLRASEPLESRRQMLERVANARPDRKVVLKPDTGQRGTGVRILDSPAEWDSALEAQDGDAIVQSFVDGVELGVFFIREPSMPSGELTSLTRKVPTRVTGNGRDTVERLILDGPHTVAAAPTLCAENRDRLLDVPEDGEEVRLSHIGAHARGTTFEDGRRHLTPALTAAVNRIAGTIPGFFYGRFDFKAPSWEAFERGENLSIIELNGLSSEPTHIYAAGTSWRNGQRILRDHWSRAIRIADHNRRNGYRPWNVSEVLRLVFRNVGPYPPTKPSKNRPQSGSCAR